MPFDGNGNWTSNYYPQSGELIKASDFNNTFIADIANGFGNCVTRDGQGVMQTNTDANNYRVINVANPVNDKDAVNLQTFSKSNLLTSTSSPVYTGRNTANLASADGTTLQIRGEDAEETLYNYIDLYRRGTLARSESWIYAKTAYALAGFSVMATDGGVEYADGTSGVKASITKWGMPDYTSVTTVAFDDNGQYTATSNGYIVIFTETSGWYFNGAIGSLPILTGGNFNSYHEADTSVYPVAKGAILTKYSGYATVYFIPCFGG